MIDQANVAELLFSLFNTIADPVMVIGEDGTYLEVFGGNERTLYDDGKPMKGQKIYSFMPKSFADFYMEKVHQTLQTQSLNIFDYQLDTEQVILPELAGPGGIQWFETRMYPLKNEIKGQRAVIALIINITERRLLQRQLQELSYEDPLTGLYNRRYFLERVRFHLHGAGSAHIMICDIDDFKAINDCWGHLCGDAVLNEFVQVLIDAMQGRQNISRFGGDEFVIALTGLDDRQAYEKGEGLRRRTESHIFTYQKQVVSVRISVGIAKLDSVDWDRSELIEEADIALYEAKKAGKNQVRIFGGI